MYFQKDEKDEDKTKRMHGLCDKLLDPSDISGIDAVHFGKINEPVAAELFEKEIKSPLQKCGLFIHREYPFIGASPDRITEFETIRRTVEIKCHYSLFKDSTKKINENLNHLETVNDNLSLKKNHEYYYQIQGQIHYVVIFYHLSYKFYDTTIYLLEGTVKT